MIKCFNAFSYVIKVQQQGYETEHEDKTAK